MEIIIEKHKQNEKHIKHYCKKLNERTSGVLKWPEVGTFDEQLCIKMKERLAVWDVEKPMEERQEEEENAEEEGKTEGAEEENLEIPKISIH